MDRLPPLCAVLLLTACLAVSAAPAAAVGQSSAARTQTAAVRGVVAAFGGEVLLPGVSVAASGPDGRTLAAVVSDEQGRFRIPALPDGPCTLVATLEGFQQLSRTVVLVAGQEASVSLELALLPISETVVVKPQVIVGMGASLGSSGLVESAAFLEAPLAEASVQAVLPLLPGIVQGPAGVSIKGGRPTQSSVLLGQANVMDPSTGDFDLRLPGDAVAFIEVLPNPYAVEFGRFSSGLTAISTRKGGSRWRASVSDINPALSTKRNKPLAILGIESFVPRVMVGGPLVGDRVFLAQSLHYRYSSRDIRSRPQNERIRRESLGSFTRVDARLGARHNLAASLAFVPERRRYANLGTFDPPEVTVNTRRHVLAAVVTGTSAVSDSTMLDNTLHISGFESHFHPQAGAPMEILPGGNRGSFFNAQDRRTRGIQWVGALSRAVQRASGLHVMKAGIDLMRNEYNGESDSRPILIRVADGTIARRVTFDGVATQHVSATDIAVFAQDRWQPVGRLVFETGIRLDRDGVLRRSTVSPRAGVRIALDGQDKLTLGGGIGRFVERTPMTIGAFEQFETRTVTTFDGAAPSGTTTSYVPYAEPGLRPSSAVTWNVEYVHRLTPAWQLKAYVLNRSGRDEFLVEPRVSGGAGQLVLSSRGRSRYRELAVIARYTPQARLTLDVSYVRSAARADLEHHSLLFGSLRSPLVRANEFGPTDTDVPNRVVGQFRYQVGAWRFASVLEWRDGFPYSVVDQLQEYVGARNRGRRFPDVRSADLSIERRIRLGRSRPYIGLQFFNAFNAFLPRDVQRNIDAPMFGGFYNADPRRLRITIRGL